ncbi:hypothetical protein GJAV_G00143870 [Gymnothorax javanicus]|nr:hypothetical protein GJAV_G00143870 [Gymnothorax javanicus]
MISLLALASLNRQCAFSLSAGQLYYARFGVLMRIQLRIEGAQICTLPSHISNLQPTRRLLCALLWTV